MGPVQALPNMGSRGLRRNGSMNLGAKPPPKGRLRVVGDCRVSPDNGIGSDPSTPYRLAMDGFWLLVEGMLIRHHSPTTGCRHTVK